jgi:hypothetical protein
MDSQLEKMRDLSRKTETTDFEANSGEKRPYRSSRKSLKKMPQVKLSQHRRSGMLTGV